MVCPQGRHRPCVLTLVNTKGSKHTAHSLCWCSLLQTDKADGVSKNWNLMRWLVSHHMGDSLITVHRLSILLLLKDQFVSSDAGVEQYKISPREEKRGKEDKHLRITSITLDPHLTSAATDSLCVLHVCSLNHNTQVVMNRALLLPGILDKIRSPGSIMRTCRMHEHIESTSTHTNNTIHPGHLSIAGCQSFRYDQDTAQCSRNSIVMPLHKRRNFRGSITNVRCLSKLLLPARKKFPRLPSVICHVWQLVAM